MTIENGHTNSTNYWPRSPLGLLAAAISIALSVYLAVLFQLPQQIIGGIAGFLFYATDPPRIVSLEVPPSGPPASASLVAAAERNDTLGLQILIAAGNADESGNAAVAAAASGASDAVSLLYKPQFGPKMLTAAAVAGRCDTALQLMAMGTAPEHAVGFRPLTSRAGDSDTCKKLTSLLDGVKVPQETLNDALHAAMGWKLELGEALLARKDIVARVAKAAHTAPLPEPAYKAVAHQMEVVSRLIDAGANPNFRGALSRSVAQRDMVLTTLLITKGADPNGGTMPEDPELNPASLPLYSALTATGDPDGTLRILNMLLRHGADPLLLVPTSDGEAPLWHVALANRITEDPTTTSAMIDLLLINGANVQNRDSKGRTALFRASTRAAIQKLLAAGAAVDARADDGQTPLLYAANHIQDRFNKPDSYHRIQLLLEAGADVNARDRQGKTPMWYAIQANDARLTSMLLTAGANPI